MCSPLRPINFVGVWRGLAQRPVDLHPLADKRHVIRSRGFFAMYATSCSVHPKSVVTSQDQADFFHSSIAISSRMKIVKG